MTNRPIGYIEYILTSKYISTQTFEDLCTSFLRSKPEYKDIIQLGGVRDKGRDGIIERPEKKIVFQFSAEKEPFKHENSSKFWKEYNNRKKENEWNEFVFVTPHRIRANEHDKISKLTNPSVRFYVFHNLESFLTNEPTGINFAKNNGLFADCSFSEHNIDPARSCIKKMDKERFEEFVNDILQMHGLISSDKKNLSVFYNNKLPDGYIVSGVLHHSIFYIYQFTTGFGFSDINSIQKGEMRTEGDLQKIYGGSIFIILSDNIELPQYNLVKKFVSGCIDKNINNLVLFINENLHNYLNIHGIFRQALRETEREKRLSLHILFLEEITYLLLTSNLYHKYYRDIQWRFKNERG